MDLIIRSFRQILWLFCALTGLTFLGFAAGFIVGSNISFSKLAAIMPGENVLWNSNKVRWDGWSAAEPTHRWSDGSKANIVFRLSSIPTGESLAAVVGVLMVNGEIPAQISLNGNRVKVQFEKIIGPGEYEIPLKAENLRIGENLLEFYFPNLRRPSNGDSRELGIAITKFQIRSMPRRSTGALKQPRLRGVATASNNLALNFAFES